MLQAGDGGAASEASNDVDEPAPWMFMIDVALTPLPPQVAAEAAVEAAAAGADAEHSVDITLVNEKLCQMLLLFQPTAVSRSPSTSMRCRFSACFGARQLCAGLIGSVLCRT
jgi:hypothetical protein